MPKICDENKSRLSALAQFIDFLSKHHGITETNDLMEYISGYNISSINKAKRELRLRTYSQMGTYAQEPIPNCEPIPANLCASEEPIPILPRAPARIENPSGLNNTKHTNKPTNTEQVEGWHPFNGSTDLVVGLVCGWMNLFDDDQPARNWLTTSIGMSSAETVKQGVLLTDQKIQAGELIANPIKYAASTIRRIHGEQEVCKSDQSQAAEKPKTVHELLLERGI